VIKKESRIADTQAIFTQNFINGGIACFPNRTSLVRCAVKKRKKHNTTEGRKTSATEPGNGEVRNARKNRNAPEIWIEIHSAAFCEKAEIHQSVTEQTKRKKQIQNITNNNLFFCLFQFFSNQNQYGSIWFPHCCGGGAACML